ncbi:hypothetical protein EDD17DRAFT_78315 [Pisolithus thermaeus]|nr:hypothetical protein EDD17DRAFT_78315 [Pisolithus thermaeus]
MRAEKSGTFFEYECDDAHIIKTLRARLEAGSLPSPLPSSRVMLLSPNAAFNIAFSCESFFYGANAVLFLTSLVILHKRRNQSNISHPMVILNGLIFLCCSTHFALELNSFIVILQTTSVNPVLRLMGAYIIESIADFLSDIFLIYRCWVIWTQTPIVLVFPFLAALGGFACAVGAARLEFTGSTDAASSLNIAGYTLSTCANVIVTSLIIYKICRTPHGLIGFSESTERRAAHNASGFAVESGVLYFPAQLAYLVLFVVKTPGSFIAGAIAIQVYGIATALIVIRVALGISLEHTSNMVVPTNIGSNARHSILSGPSARWCTDGLEAVTDIGSNCAVKEPMFTSEYSSFPSTATVPRNDLQGYSPALVASPTSFSNSHQSHYGPRYPSHPSGKPIPEIA